MNSQFTNQVKKILKHGRKELKKTGNIQMKAYIFGSDSKVYVSPISWYDDPASKHLAISHVRNMAKFRNAECVVLLADTFMGKTGGIRPSLDPERKEAISLFGEDEKGKFVVHQEYTRNFNNKIKLGKIESGRACFGGLMAEEPFGVCS